MKTTRARILLAAVACAGYLAGARPAVADTDVEVQLNVRVPDPKDPKQKDQAPGLEATVIRGQKVPLEKFSLSTTNKGQKVTLLPSKIRGYTEGNETLGLALVLCGSMVWIGTDQIPDIDEGSRYQGVLMNLEQAIDKLQLGSAGPEGSKGVVISYSTGAEVKVPMGPLKQITGGALGGQKDYFGKVNDDMVQGITSGIAELRKITTARKVMIIVGDGNDTNIDGAKAQLADLKKQAAQEHIETYSIVWKSQISSEGAVITTMVPGTKTVTSIDGIASEMNGVISSMADRYYLSFPGWDDKTGTGLPWDGKPHDIVLKIDQTELAPVEGFVLAPIWNPPTKKSYAWILYVVAALGAILFIALVIRIVKGGGRSAAEPAMAPGMPAMAGAPGMPGMPMGMPMQPGMAPPPMEAPKQGGPMKTVMIGAGGDQDGFPIVGWLVALNGQDAYRTQRLRTGLTKIGTAPPADIVVNDGFMSTEHCQITCSPSGFTLIDNGSTNGCYVNDRKVQKQELLDNDLITLGKTNFKFKSIN